ncbi:MAG: RNA-binding S4 domain-containing protein [Proteobacteria bacterium]|nr:RNA-binding S4 domain-containing protein [Pseudomonadota bacterium]
MQSVFIDTDYIELDKLLKRENLAASGGEARFLISQGLARVNGVVESRKRRKLYPGDLVICHGVELQVEARPCSAQGDESEQGG